MKLLLRLGIPSLALLATGLVLAAGTEPDEQTTNPAANAAGAQPSEADGPSCAGGCSEAPPPAKRPDSKRADAMLAALSSHPLRVASML